MGFLSRCCSGNGPHLALRGESLGFSEAWWKFGVLELVMRDSGPRDHIASGKSGLILSCDGRIGIPLHVTAREIGLI